LHYIISKLSPQALLVILWNTQEKFWKHDMEGRMTVCNLSIEMGARGGMIAQIKRLLII
jgi:homoaconitase/3-isopropylmalate dehydratase large subunit